MCFNGVSIPKPKPATALPNPAGAAIDATADQRRFLSGKQGRSETLLSKVSNEDFSGIGTKKKLGGE